MFQVPPAGTSDAFTSLVVVGICCSGLPRVPFLLLLLEITLFSFGNCVCPLLLQSSYVCAGTINCNIHPLATGKGESPRQFYALSPSPRHAHERAQVPIWVSLPRGAPVRSLVRRYRPRLWAEMYPSPPARGTLSVKAGGAEG